MKTIIKTYLFALLTLSVISCGKDSLVNDISEIEGGVWNKDDSKQFSFKVDDVKSGYDFFLLVRNNKDYEYRNLYLFVDLEFPNSDKLKDTVYCELANKYGKWLGKGVGADYNSEILYKINQQFPDTGEFKMTIMQGMRGNEINGITNVGISVRKNKNNL